MKKTFDKYLLYIEPGIHERSEDAVMDEWTALIKKAMDGATRGFALSGTKFIPNCVSDYKYKAPDGFSYPQGEMEYSTQAGYYLNPLALHYIMWYRDGIDANEWRKLKLLKEFYDNGYSYYREAIFDGRTYHCKSTPSNSGTMGCLMAVWNNICDQVEEVYGEEEGKKMIANYPAFQCDLPTLMKKYRTITVGIPALQAINNAD